MILEAIIGSHAYGLAAAESDVDRRGVFVAPTEAFWRLEKPPTAVEGPSPEQLSWEVEHFCRLALKSNPTVLETLVSPLVEICTPLGEELKALLPAFLSRYAVRAYTRATEMQLSRAGRNLKPKQLMHVVRLRLLGLHLVRTGELNIAADHSLLKIRDGSMPWDEAVSWAHRLGDELAGRKGRCPRSPTGLALTTGWCRCAGGRCELRGSGPERGGGGAVARPALRDRVRAHLYGFPSRDSDVDLRGVHVLPVAEVLGLRHGPETKERMWVRDGVEIDLVTHDVQKFCKLLTRPNGYVLEQLLSPLVVHTTDGHRRLVELAAGCLTSRHGHH